MWLVGGVGIFNQESRGPCNGQGPEKQSGACLCQRFSGRGRGRAAIERRTAIRHYITCGVASARRKRIMENTASTSQAAAAQGGERRLHGVALFSVLAALMLTLLLEALDQTVVGTALPRIVASLQGFDRYTWVVTAYLLGSTTMVPIVGKLSDQFGRKWFFIAGVVVFLLGSALSGASQTMNQLIAFRALQGLGAGTGIALVFTV